MDARSASSEIDHLTQPQDATQSPQPVSRRRATQWNILFSYGMLGLTIVRNFLLVPIFFKYIGDFEYKAWLASGSVAVQLLAVDFGLMGALSQMVASAYGRKDAENIQKLVGTGLLIALGIAVFVTIVGIAAAFLVPSMIRVSGSIADNITLAFLVVAIANGIQLISVAMRAILGSLQRPFGPGVQGLLSEILAIGVTLILLFNGFGLLSIAIGLLVRACWNSITNTIQFLYVFHRVLGLRVDMDRAILAILWRLSAYQFLAQLAGRINISFPPFLIGVFVGPEAAGSFALTTRAHDMIRTITLMFGGALNPALAHLYGEGDRRRFREFMFSRTRIQVLFGSIATLGAIVFNESFMRLWIGDGNFSGQFVNVLVGISVFVGMLASIGYDGLYCMGALKRTGIVVLIESALRLAVMIPMLIATGVWAVPFATTLTQFGANCIPFFKTLRQRLEIASSEVYRLGIKCAGSLLIAGAATIPAICMASWMTTWPRLIGIAVVYSVSAGALGALWEWPLLLSVRRPKTGRAKPAAATVIPP